MTARALECVRVLDLSQYLPGPYAAQILADLGADVVKVEPPAGDPMTRLGPIDGDGVSAFYKLVNGGKTVVPMDLKTAPGRAAFESLVARADALVESFRPGALERLGLGAARLRALNPRLVHCALSGFGQTGPYAQRAGHDVTYMALGGGLATSGDTARPGIAYPPTADFAGGMQAALCVLAGLLRRAGDGRGATIDVSLMETVLAWQPTTLTGALRPGHAPARGAVLLNGGAACYRVYETGDGRFVALGALEAKFWAAFCRAVGHDPWIARQDEPMPQEALIGEVAALFAGAPLAAWVSRLEGVDCCFQPVLEPAEVPSHPHVAARGLVHRVEGADPRVEVSFPALFGGGPPAPRAPVRQGTVGEIARAWGVIPPR